jgi:ribosome-associated toxin RatA of RatAB toxin-antitoxin module
MALEQQSYTTTVAASPEECFSVVTDFAAYPSWSSAVRTAAVAERYPDGLAKRVAMELDIKIRRIHYVLEYQYERPGRLTWRLVDGDLRAVEGSYTFAGRGDGRTEVTCTQGVDIGFWIPGFLRSTFERQALKDSVQEFAQEVARRRA